MKLKEGEIYYLWLKKDDSILEHRVLIKIKKELKGKPLKAIFDDGFFRIRDERFSYLFSANSGFYSSRFVIAENPQQLELDF